MRELRLSRRLTQEALAERLGVATPHVQAIERGVRNLTLHSLGKLADALDVEVIQLFVAPQAVHDAGKPGRPRTLAAEARGPVPMVVYDDGSESGALVEPVPPAAANPIKRAKATRTRRRR